MNGTVDIKDVEIVLTEEDIKNVNIESLKSMFEKSVAILQSALFSQAGKESKRIERLRELLTDIEDDLTGVEVYKNLDPQDKISLYTTMSRNGNNSLAFLNKLQANVSSGMEIISSLENKSGAQSSKNRKLLGDGETAQKDDVMELIRRKISEKLGENNG